VLSQTADYAVRAMLGIAARASGDEAVRVADLAKELRIPQNYLSKILHRLAQRGLLVSARGRRGGFRLAARAGSTPLAEVVRAFDVMEQRTYCLLGRPTCSDRRPCAAHARWKRVSEHWLTFFRETTLAELIVQEESAGAAERPRAKVARAPRDSR